MAAAASKAGASAPEAAGSAEAPLQYSLLLQYLVGDKRQPRLLEPGSLGGIPSPSKSEEQKMIERAMESCAFKAVLACVGGEARLVGPLGGCRLGGPWGSLLRPRAWEAKDLWVSTIDCPPTALMNPKMPLLILGLTFTVGNRNGESELKPGPADF